jgi:hypothetical protein
MQHAAEAVVEMAQNDIHRIFWYPVDTQLYPHYLAVVPEPTDLSTIATKIQCGLYANDLAVLDDLHRMLMNCIRFNGNDTFFTPLAVQLCSAFDVLADKCKLTAGSNYEAVALTNVHARRLLAQFCLLFPALLESAPLQCPTAWRLVEAAEGGATESEVTWALERRCVGCESLTPDLQSAARDALQWIASTKPIPLTSVTELDSDDAVLAAVLCELEALDVAKLCVYPDLARPDFGGPCLHTMKTKLNSRLYHGDVEKRISQLEADVDALVDASVETFGPGSPRAKVASLLRAEMPKLRRRVTQS